MEAVLCIGGCRASVNVDVEYNVHGADLKIIGKPLRAKDRGDALSKAKRRRKQYPGASFVTRYEAPTTNASRI